MCSDAPLPLQPFWDLASAPLRQRAVALALDWQLFKVLDQPMTAAHVARTLSLHPDNAEVWLDLLWSQGLLERHLASSAASTYVRSALAARYFCTQGDRDCAQAWTHRCQVLAAAAERMEALLRQGPQAPGASFPAGTWAQAARAQILQEQRAVTAAAVLTRLKDWRDWPRQGRFLDLGGGPGTVALALAEHFPEWTGVVSDLPDTAAVAAEHIRVAGLSERLTVAPADLDQTLPGTDYDLIWCSSVLHFLHDPVAMLRRCRLALRPGGRLLLAHAERPQDRHQAARVLPFYAPMLWRGRVVPTADQIGDWLQQAGFRQVRACGPLAFPMAPVWLHAATAGTRDATEQPPALSS